MGYAIKRQEKKYNGRNGFDPHTKKLTAVDGSTFKMVNSYNYCTHSQIKIEVENTFALL